MTSPSSRGDPIGSPIDGAYRPANTHAQQNVHGIALSDVSFGGRLTLVVFRNTPSEKYADRQIGSFPQGVRIKKK